jgi:hypothetical protein
MSSFTFSMISILDSCCSLLLLPASFDIAHNFVNGSTNFVTSRAGHGVGLCCHGSLVVAVAVILAVAVAVAAVTVATAASVSHGDDCA